METGSPRSGGASTLGEGNPTHLTDRRTTATGAVPAGLTTPPPGTTKARSRSPKAARRYGKRSGWTGSPYSPQQEKKAWTSIPAGKRAGVGRKTAAGYEKDRLAAGGAAS